MTLPLRPFQLIGSEFLQARRAAFLCDDAGLGKSAQALHACDQLGLRRVLCVGPAVAGVSWPQQLSLWSPDRKFVRVTADTTQFREKAFYFVSYDLLSRTDNKRLRQLLSSPENRWDALILDEAQCCKNRQANRTKAIYGSRGVALNAERVFVLSGTLTPNHAGEAWTHLRALAPDILREADALEEYEFINKYCRYEDTDFGRRIYGSKNMADLRERIAPVVLRRRKDDVLPELPPIDFLTAPIEADKDAVSELLFKLLAEIADELGAPDVEEMLRRVTEFSAYATARRALGLAKIKGCVEWCVDRFESGEEKLLVFAHHREVVERLTRELIDFGPVTYHGDTLQCDRFRAVDRFQNDPTCKVFVGQIMSAGTAITLTAAKTVLLAEFSGTPGVNYQAASRAHRMGQRDGVQAYFAMVPGTLDEAIADLAARRAREIAELFD